VVEVDEHGAVGDDALAADRDVLVGGDGALLAEHGLGADLEDAFVDADLAAVAEPRPAAEADDRVLADLEPDLRADEGEPVELQPAPEPQLPVGEPQQQAHVLQVEHPVAPHEREQRERASAQGRRLLPDLQDLGRLGQGR